MKLIKTRILKGIGIFLMIFPSFQYFYGMIDGISYEEYEEFKNNNKEKNEDDDGTNFNQYQYDSGDVNSQYLEIDDQESNKKYICNYCCCCCC